MTEEVTNLLQRYPEPRSCPSCKSVIDRLQLSAFPIPTEQVFMPWLRMINKALGSSLRTFGQSGMNELQFLAFTSICNKCGHISWWDLPVGELEAIVTGVQETPVLTWSSNPEALRFIVEKLSPEAAASFRALLHDVTPKGTNE
jgi:hypothetical protein